MRQLSARAGPILEIDEDIRVIVIRQAQTETDSTVRRDKLKDDVEDVEPGRIVVVVELSTLPGQLVY